MKSSVGSGVIEAGSAALRKVIANPLKRRKTGQTADASYDGGNGGDQSGESINTIIEGEIIPRLMMAHAAKLADRSEGFVITQSEVERFADLPRHYEAADIVREIEGFLDKGASIEAVLIDLLAPAARHLGELWENDEADFIEVTMALWRLEEGMRSVCERSPVIRPGGDDTTGRALFASMPGDQHAFGTAMVEEVFAHAGWRTAALARPQRTELLDLISREPFDIVGLTLTRSCPSGSVTNLVTAMRKVSANPHMHILIGGHMINQNPEIVAETGADGTGADARAALDVARALVQSAPMRAHMLL
ncbi:MAG: cobalamin-dependent protein [Erythrobacter sp.]|jgi:methanogenic corrinoid protein MtbC1|nr:cobalamin-dependent protein [Erythrobacter sp.]